MGKKLQSAQVIMDRDTGRSIAVAAFLAAVGSAAR